jgi:hemerythrin-like domain-containing protein
MENNTQPIKRSEQLAPLSREHHDGLLFAWKLRQGLNNNTAIETLRNYCHWFWKQHIKKHFHDEEDILLMFIPSDNKLAIQLREEHDNIRELILSIDHKPDTITIGLLADFISRHIRFEERILFNYLERNLSQRQLDHIHSQLEIVPISSDEWKEEFWLKKDTSQN